MSDLVDFDYNLNTVLGIGICLGSIIGASIGCLLQKKALDSSRRRRQDLTTVCTVGLWWCGFVLYLLATLSGIFALAFLPLTMNSMLGNLSLVVNALIAPNLLNESISKKTWICTATICLGGLIIVFFGPRDEAEISLSAVLDLVLRLPVIILFGVLFLLALVGIGIIWHFILHPVPFYQLGRSVLGSKIEDDDDDIPVALLPLWTLPIAYSSMLGIIDSCSQVMLKLIGSLAVSETEQGASEGSAFSSFLPYVLIVCVIILFPIEQVLFARGLFLFPAVIIFPIMQVCRTSFTLVSGGIFFDEFSELTLATGILFIFGTLITLFGAYILASEDSLTGDHTRGLILLGGTTANIVTRKLEELSKISSNSYSPQGSLDEEQEFEEEGTNLRIFGAMPFGSILGVSSKKPTSAALKREKSERHRKKASNFQTLPRNWNAMELKKQYERKSKLASATLPRNWNKKKKQSGVVSTTDDISLERQHSSENVSTIDIILAQMNGELRRAEENEEFDINDFQNDAINLSDDMLIELQQDTISKRDNQDASPPASREIVTVFSGNEEKKEIEIPELLKPVSIHSQSQQEKQNNLINNRYELNLKKDTCFEAKNTSNNGHPPQITFSRVPSRTNLLDDKPSIEISNSDYTRSRYTRHNRGRSTSDIGSSPVPCRDSTFINPKHLQVFDEMSAEPPNILDDSSSITENAREQALATVRRITGKSRAKKAAEEPSHRRNLSASFSHPMTRRFSAPSISVEDLEALNLTSTTDIGALQVGSRNSLDLRKMKLSISSREELADDDIEKDHGILD